MNILFFSHYFPPEVNAPARRTFDHCKKWVELGHNVTVVTNHPNHPNGKIFPGYSNNLYSRENMDGISVLRVYTFLTPNAGFLLRILNFILYGIFAVYFTMFIKKPDVVIGTSPQFFCGLFAAIYSKIRRVPFVLEIRDLWPESIIAVGALRNRSLIAFLTRLELWMYRAADQVVTVTQSFKDDLIGKGVSANKVAVVLNGINFSHFSPRPPSEKLLQRYDCADSFNIGYIGTLGMAHSLGTVLQAARRLEADGYSGKFNFFIIGDGAERSRLESEKNSQGINNVHFTGLVAKDEISDYWSILDLSLVHLKKTPLFRTVIPSKIFESIGMGKPILHGVEGESAEIIEKYQFGVLFEPENTGDLVDKIISLYSSLNTLDTFRNNCLEYGSQFDRNRFALEMMEVVENAVK